MFDFEFEIWDFVSRFHTINVVQLTATKACLFSCCMTRQCLRVIYLGVFTLVFEKLKINSSGVSSVLGEVLITGVFVLSLGSLFVFVNSIDTPVDSTHLSVEEWIDTPSNTIYLRHVGGESIDTKDLNINVIICGTDHVYSSADISENLGKSFWELSDVIEINTSKEWGISIPEENDVIVKLINLDSKEILNPKYRISSSPKPSPSIDLDVVGNSVVPQDAFISSFKVLGAAISMSGSYDMMVTSRLKVGNETFDPWGNYALPVTSNVNDGETHLWNLPATYPAGTAVTISGKSWQHTNSGLNYSFDTSWKSYMVVDSTSNPPNLKVLRNGDDVPLIPGLDPQPPVEEFIKDYAKDGKIVLEENEAIFLFELGTTNLNSTAADFQDLVILLSVDPAPA